MPGAGAISHARLSRLAWCYVIAVVAACGAGLARVWWSWLMLGLGTAAVMVIATSGRKSPDRLAWWSLAAATVAFSVVDVLFAGNPDRPVRPLEILYIPAYLLAGLGLWLLLAGARGDRGDMFDLLVLGIGVASLVIPLVLFGWPGVSHPAGARAMLYPVADLMLVVLTIRLYRTRPGAVASLLALGGLTQFVTGMLVAFAGMRRAGWEIGAMWGVSVGAWGLAALLTPARDPARPTAAVQLRSMLLCRLVVLLPPLVLLVASVRQSDDGGIVLALCCGLSSLLVVGRLAHFRADDPARDPLTGLGSAVSLVERADEVLAGDRGAGAIALFLIDLHDFHLVNDTRGSAGGDLVLAQVGGRLARQFGKSDMVVRTSEDRFGVLTISDTDPGEFAARLISAVAEPLGRGTHQLHLMSSVGYSVGEPASTGLELMREADLALHEAKRQGPGYWVRFTPELVTRATRRVRLRADLAEAVGSGQLVMHYQQIADLRDGTILGFEALVRWNHPELGRIPTEEFIALAESSGHIQDLGTWVMRQALHDTARLNEAAGRPIFVHINASAEEIRREGYSTQVEAALASAGVAPDSVIVEITESVLISGHASVLATLHRLKSMGVGLAMDDFGTGYSSLSMLRELPFDVVKIDKSFVLGMRPGPQEDVIAGILRIAEGLGRAVVAEGIETTAVRDLLVALGCQMGQGYLFSPPVAIEAAIDQVWRRRPVPGPR
jgi:diguanylate cyclase (GGDEF)-like protein